MKSLILAFSLMGAAFSLHTSRSQKAPPSKPTEEDLKAALIYV